MCMLCGIYLFAVVLRPSRMKSLVLAVCLQYKMLACMHALILPVVQMNESLMTPQHETCIGC